MRVGKSWIMIHQGKTSQRITPCFQTTVEQSQSQSIPPWIEQRKQPRVIWHSRYNRMLHDLFQTHALIVNNLNDNSHIANGQLRIYLLSLTYQPIDSFCGRDTICTDCLQTICIMNLNRVIQHKIIIEIFQLSNSIPI